ncbi:MAG: 50S ribosomal protein L1 [Balneolaceae bacterium]
MAKRGKRYRQAAELIDPDLEYTIEEACDLVLKTAKTKFDSTIDMDLHLGVDPRHADQMVRGTVVLPHGTGKDVKVLALVNESKQAEAEEAGADYVGMEDYIQKIEEGWTDIDVIIATPDVMGKLGKLGRVLGPKGLMPNPKSGTVTNEVAEAVKEFKAGKLDFRVDKFGILHMPIGKASFDANTLRENAKAFLQTVNKMRPASAKGNYIRSAYVSSTMGPSIPVTRSSIASI